MKKSAANALGIADRRDEPAPVDVVFRHGGASVSRALDGQSVSVAQAHGRLESRLRAAFEIDPLEDGMNHPAEDIIGEVLQSTDEQPVFEWLRALSLDAACPSLAASVLRCLGRRERPGTVAWRVRIVQEALATDNVEMRDAAVQAAESWGDPEMRETIQAHSEPEPWLREYIADVIDDLGAAGLVRACHV